MNSSHLTTKQKMLLFQMRSQSFPVFLNAKFLNKNTTCPCCGLEEDTMSHQLNCSVLTNNDLIRDPSVNIKDIYHEDDRKQAQITQIFEQAIKRRKIYMKHSEILNKV